MAFVTFDSATRRHPGADHPRVAKDVTPRQGYVQLSAVASGERIG